MINKINCLTYCREFEKVENYEKAIADKEHTWICHHRLETQPVGWILGRTSKTRGDIQ